VRQRLARRGVEEVLHAAKGFLVAGVPAGEVELQVRLYHDNFFVFASEEYDESLVWAIAEVGLDDPDRLQRGNRSRTFQLGVEATRRPGTDPVAPRPKHGENPQELMPLGRNVDAKARRVKWQDVEYTNRHLDRRTTGWG